MWDLFHPQEGLRGQKPNNPYKFRRPLPQIQRTEDYGQVWQTAPYASDYQHENPFSKPPNGKQIDFDQ